MNKILMSIRPDWCEKIFNGEKTVEIRKNFPRIKPPFKVIVYKTRSTKKIEKVCEYGGVIFLKSNQTYNLKKRANGGEVIGEFTCDEIVTVDCDSWAPWAKEWERYIDKESCVDRFTFIKYGNFHICYGWHITNPILYEVPKELNEYGVTRPPQSWQYLEVKNV